MDDDVVQRINQLADEEHHLEREHGGRPLTGEERQRLDAIKVSLDQCWDLLRQRRARRDSGLDPDDAEVRSETTVEGYQQ